jgi:hypothetical protein
MNERLAGLLSCLSCVAVLAGCAAPVSPSPDDVGESEDALRTSYGELIETLGDGDLDRWIDVRSKLVAGFDRICGDTICSGDYSNLTTVRLACSSTRSALKMKDCLWVLAGNIDYVDGRTGKLTSEARTFACHVPVASNAKTFLAGLQAAGDGALDAPIPGTGKSFYDALTTCFEGVVAAPPPASTKTFYLELADHQWNASPEAGAAWSSTKAQLAKAFDDVCGDTFCEGD